MFLFPAFAQRGGPCKLLCMEGKFRYLDWGIVSLEFLFTIMRMIFGLVDKTLSKLGVVKNRNDAENFQHTGYNRFRE